LPFVCRILLACKFTGAGAWGGGGGGFRVPVKNNKYNKKLKQKRPENYFKKKLKKKKN
jgi:hypothetical protein